tara:strand:+ start:145 stop:486 length:342 start_codon:yes stop_codon:yes gene_type:complete
MRKLPTTITTKENSVLHVTISPYETDTHQRLPVFETPKGITLGEGHAEDATHVIEFWYEEGALCSSYFTETFMAIPDNQGLCLEANHYEYQSINSDQVTICKMLIKSYELPND